jgi:hypothetical protein
MMQGQGGGITGGVQCALRPAGRVEQVVSSFATKGTTLVLVNFGMAVEVLKQWPACTQHPRASPARLSSQGQLQHGNKTQAESARAHTEVIAQPLPLQPLM